MARERATEVDGAAMAGRDREVYVAAMFDRIAEPYDRLNRVISLGRDRKWRRIAIALGGVGPGAHVLDLGCGTGDFIVEALRAMKGEGSVVGIDLAPNMLDVARKKIEPLCGGVELALRTGNANQTGLPDRWADVVTMGWVLRNLGERAPAYAEILRVLKPGGRFVCLESSRPVNPVLRAGFAAYLRGVMPALVRLTGGDRASYRYLADSTQRFLTAPELAQELAAAGFTDVRTRTLALGAMAIHIGRKAP